MKSLAVIGAGNWGKNLVRTYSQLLGERLKCVCDLNEAQLKKIQRDYRSLTTTTDFNKVLNDPDIEAVAIATTANTHFKLAKQALEAGRHVYVEKPMTLSIDDAKTLQQLSEKSRRKLMVGHILVYHPAVQKLKQLIDSGE